MSTSSSVAIENADGSITGIYAHWDGYLKGIGVELIQNYKTVEEVQGLISLGDCSSIFGGAVEAFHRDRGRDWEDAAPSVHDDYKSFVGEIGQEFNYLFKGGIWYVMEAYADTDELKSVKEALEQMA